MILSEPRRRIAVLHTGGTIGMRRTPRGFAPYEDFPAVLAKALEPLAAGLPLFDISAFATPIDSSEATPADWLALAVALRDLWADYDGFVVLHGTDTMAFSAAALSFMLRDLDKPVVLTGAQIAMAVEGSDGLGNVVSALHFAAQPVLREVCIAFDGLLLRGNRATKVSTRRVAAFACPDFEPLGRIVDGVPVLEAGLLLQRAAGAPVFDLAPAASGLVASLRFVPGLAPAAFDACLEAAPRAIILECYGSGNVPSLNGATGVFLAKARERGIAVIARTQVFHGGTSPGAYAAGSLLTDHGVIDGGDMTFEASYAKLCHLAAQNADARAIAAAFARNWAGERS